MKKRDEKRFTRQTSIRRDDGRSKMESRCNFNAISTESERRTIDRVRDQPEALPRKVPLGNNFLFFPLVFVALFSAYSYALFFYINLPLSILANGIHNLLCRSILLCLFSSTFPFSFSMRPPFSFSLSVLCARLLRRSSRDSSPLFSTPLPGLRVCFNDTENPPLCFCRRLGSRWTR